MFKPIRLRAGFLVTLVAGSAVLASSPVLAAAAPADCTGTASSTWITVAVNGVRNASGLIAVTLYADDGSRFLAKHGSLYTGRVPAREGTTEVCLFVPKPGVYAIATYHDENASRKIDRSGVGLPTEGFGFSNNPSTFLGIPAFSKVRLAIPRSKLKTTITLRYP
jgi:uncharacterized protein (DUF2141 family)